MLVFLKYFLKLSIFKLTPQELPSSTYLAGFSLFFYCTTSFLISLSDFNWPIAIFAGIVDTLILILISYSLLSLLGFSNRLTQTITALAGSGATVSSFALIPVYWLNYANQHEYDTTMPVIFLLMIVLWSLWVIAHIFRYAISTQRYIASIIAILFYILEVIIGNIFFPLSS